MEKLKQKIKQMQKVKACRPDLRSMIDTSQKNSSLEDIDQHFLGKCQKETCSTYESDRSEKRLSVESGTTEGVDYIYLKSDHPHKKLAIQIAVHLTKDAEYFDDEIDATEIAWHRLKQLCRCELCKANLI